MEGTECIEWRDLVSVYPACMHAEPDKGPAECSNNSLCVSKGFSPHVGEPIPPGAVDSGVRAVDCSLLAVAVQQRCDWFVRVLEIWTLKATACSPVHQVDRTGQEVSNLIW